MIVLVFASTAAKTSVATASGCTGVTVPPGASIQNAVDGHRWGTTFCLSGNYTTSSPIQPKHGDAFIAAGPTQISGSGAGIFAGGKNVTYRGLSIGPSHGNGIRPGSGSVIRNNYIHGNPKCGISSIGSGMLITNNEIAYNGSTSTSPISQACGLKILGIHGVIDSGAGNIISNNAVHDNVHTALWVDCDGHDNTFTGNQVYNNSGVAFSEETSYSDTFSNNNVHDNGFGYHFPAVSILDSTSGVFTNNTFNHNYAGVRIWADSRATRTTAAPGLGCADANRTGYIPSHISVKDNTFSTQQRSGFAHSVRSTAAVFDGNCWTIDTWAAQNWQVPADTTATWNQWRAAGQDPNGVRRTTAC